MFELPRILAPTKITVSWYKLHLYVYSVCVFTSHGPCYDVGWVGGGGQLKELSCLGVALVDATQHAIEKKAVVSALVDRSCTCIDSIVHIGCVSMFNIQHKLKLKHLYMYFDQIFLITKTKLILPSN